MEIVANNFYEVTLRDELAIILFKNDVFKLLCNRNNSDSLFEILYKIGQNHKIKALLFSNEPECLGEKVYDTFLNKLMFQKNKSKESETVNFDDRKLRIKEIIILNRFVEYIANYKKLCFTVLRGGIVTPFFGLSLATDIRYATPETYFSLAHNKYGLHPSAGLPYFLVHQLGHSKAIELMLSEKISAKEALKLGLINKIVPEKGFLDLVVEDIKEMTRYNISALNSTKKLSSYARNFLSDYLEFEGIYKA